jgi:AmmeMemoRadiSam system protein B
VLIGTAHQYSRNLFHLCAKDFECPIATLACDTQFVTQLAHRYGLARAFQDEFLHKREHSLELQLPFLSALVPGATIVPVLVGGFHSMLARNRYPHEYEEYETFSAALAELIRERVAGGSRVCFVAGVDMAHIGRSFGDEGALSQEKMAEIARRDAEYLVAIEARDKKRLFDHMAEDCDARRMCGFPTLYTVLDVMDRIGWQTECCTVKYEQAVDYVTDCAVTFAGMAMYRVVT